MSSFQAQLLKQQHALPFTSPFAISSLTKKDIKEEDEQHKDAAGEKRTVKHQQNTSDLQAICWTIWLCRVCLPPWAVMAESRWAVLMEAQVPMKMESGNREGQQKHLKSWIILQHFPQRHPAQYFVARKYAHFQKIIYKKIRRQFRKKSCEEPA